MLIENEPKFAKFEDDPLLIFGLILIEVILMAVCALSVVLLNQQMSSRPMPQQDVPVILIPATLPPTAIPTVHYSDPMPVVLSVSESEQVWIVTKIKTLGYELDGQHYDLATFSRVDGQEKGQGYCINRGWDVPDLGTEYLLTTGNTYIPVQQSETDPLQKFLKIQ